MNKNIELFLTFFKIGITTFGGGYAMIPIIKDELVEKKKWITNDELLEIAAIAESTPGPIAINTGTFVGYRIGGFLGSLLSTIGIFLPSLLIIFTISLFFDKFLENRYVAYAFVGIKCAVAFLILKAALDMILRMKKRFISIFLFAIVGTLMIVFNFLSVSFSSIYFILAGGLIGLIFYSIYDAKQKEGGEKQC